MVNGVDAIVAKVTSGDEFGIYREYFQAIDNRQVFLLLSCTERDEAIRIGGQMAAVLNVRFRNELPKPEKEDGTSEVVSDPETNAELSVYTSVCSGQGKPRRVSGIGPKIQGLIRSGADDLQIEEELLYLYLAAGHTRESGIALLRPYIKELRKTK